MDEIFGWVIPSNSVLCQVKSDFRMT